MTISKKDWLDKMNKTGGNLTIINDTDVSNHPIQLLLEQQGYKTIVKDAWSGREIEGIVNCFVEWDEYGTTINLKIKPRESVFCVR